MNSEVNSCVSKYVTDSTNTSVVILPASAGETYTIYGYDIACSTADTIMVMTGANIRAGYYLGAQSGVIRNFYPLFFRSNPGEAFSITKGISTTPVQISVFFSTQTP